MLFSQFFIKHPRFSAVIAIIMVLAGAIAMLVLPVSQYPQITPPQIVVTASYPGASAEVLVNTVAVPIENQVNGIDGVMYMTSSANDSGSYKLTVTFDIGYNPDMAQVKVENRIEQVKAYLPETVTQEGVNIFSQSANLLGFLVLESPNGTYDDLYLSNFAYTNLHNPLERIAGVAQATIFGPQYSIRVWLNPEKITSLGLNSSDVINAIETQNIVAAVGSVGSAPSSAGNNFLISLAAKGLLNTVQDFENIIITKSTNGGIIKLKDIAEIEMGADTYQVKASYNNSPSVVIQLAQSVGSNSLDVMKNVKKEMEKLSKAFPPDMELKMPYDSTLYVKASISGILTTLAITFGLVILVVFIFLQNVRPTLIPLITIPVSLVATFTVIYALGFDINILTLFALILAIGLVVDDAIIVVERVQYLMKFENMDSVPASIQAMKDIGSSIVATTLVLLSIFIPVAMMAGITGKIYQQFAVTIAAAIVFSAINALTLSPALCAIFLHKDKIQKAGDSNIVFKNFNKILTKATNLYLKFVKMLTNNLKITIALTIIVIAAVFLLFRIIPDAFIPEEDQGIILANIEMSATTPINQTEKLINEMSEEILKMDGIDFVIGVAGESMLGGSGENIGLAAIGLAPWSERTNKDLSIEAITAKLMEKFSKNPFASVDFFAMPSIPGIGKSGGLSFNVIAMDNNMSLGQLAQGLDKLLAELNQNKAFSYAFATFSPNTPHLYMDIDRTKLEYMNVPLSNLFEVLQNNLGSRYVNNITLQGQINKVIIQADYNYRMNISDIDNLYVPSSDDTLIPIKEFINFKTVMSPRIIYRYNQYASAAVTAAAATGISTGQAIDIVEQKGAELGSGFGIAWTGLSLQEVETAGLAFILIGFAFVFSYLFLVALYESWLIAFSVILTNIFAILGSLIGLYLMSLSLSIYAQLGIILLIGLASKNAILIVEFTTSYRRQGMSIMDASVKGASERYRAVLMTALTFILGIMPMIFATGAGASSQIAIGTGIFFGMILATVIGVIFVPAYFALFATIGKIQPDNATNNVNTVNNTAINNKAVENKEAVK